MVGKNSAKSDNGLREDEERAESIANAITSGFGEKIVAVIPACGWGGQMFPLTGGMPKTLLPVGDAPLLVQILRSLDERYFSKAFILCNEWYEMIKSYVDAFVALDNKEVSSNSSGMSQKKSKISVEVTCIKDDQSKTRAAALRKLHKELTDPFLLHYADVLIHGLSTRKWDDIWHEYERLRQREDILALLLVSKMFKYPVGVISMDEERVITDYAEKPPTMLTEYANCAVALFSRSFVANNHVTADHEDMFKDSLVHFVKNGGRAAAFEMRSWTHLQQPRDWLEEQKKHYEHLREPGWSSSYS